MQTAAQKEFLKIFSKVDYSKRDSKKFRDFCLMSAYCLALPFYPDIAQKELKEVYSRYKHEDVVRFDCMLKIMIDEMETNHLDFLGGIFEGLELGNSYVGQFFTPYPVCLMMARMQMGDNLKEEIKRKGFLRVSEPTCGAGSMIIAVREVLLLQGCNPSMDIYVEMTDIDELAFLMSYIQISLYGIPARIIHGDSLSMKTYREMFTPVYFLNQWGFRLAVDMILQGPAEVKQERTIPETTNIITETQNEIIQPVIRYKPEKQVQLELF